MKVPRNVSKALVHLNTQADNFIRCNERVWFGEHFDIIESLTEIPTSLLNDSFKEQLTEAAETCEKLARMADADAQKLREALSHVERRMTAQAESDQQAQEQEEMSCAATS